jgi:hypothetical protein
MSRSRVLRFSDYAFDLVNNEGASLSEIATTVNISTADNPTDLPQVEHDFLGDVIGVWLSGVICLLGLAGNVVSVAVIFKAFGQSPMFYVLRVVAIADGVFLLMVFLLNTVMNLCSVDGDACHRSYVQFIFWPVLMTAQMLTVWLAVLVSAERFVAICHPLLTASLCTMRRARRSIAVMLVACIAFNVPRYWEYDPDFNKTEVGSHAVYRYVYSATLYSIFLFFLPLLLLVFLNTRLVLCLKDGKRQWQSLQQHQRKEQNLSVIPLSIVLIFFVCGTPSLAVNVIEAINNDVIEHAWFVRLMTVANLLVVLNSASNFIIYFLFGRKFRQKLIDSCCGYYCCQTLTRYLWRGRIAYHHVISTPQHHRVARATCNSRQTALTAENKMCDVSKSIAIQLADISPSVSRDY